MCQFFKNHNMLILIYNLLFATTLCNVLMIFEYSPLCQTASETDFENNVKFINVSYMYIENITKLYNIIVQ